jgi:hypothetical protein
MSLAQGRVSQLPARSRTEVESPEMPQTLFPPPSPPTSLTTCPDVHGLAIRLLPQDLRGQIAWCARKPYGGGRGREGP